MIRKSRILALSVATAGVIGFGAPMASAATTPGLGDNGGLSQDQFSSNNDPSSAFGGDPAAAFGGSQAGALDPSSLGSTASDPSQQSDPSYGQDNGAWGGGWGNKHQKQEKQIQGIQICNNKIIVINVFGEQKKNDDSSDPGWSSDPGRESGKNMFTFKNTCKQDNDWQR